MSHSHKKYCHTCEVLSISISIVLLIISEITFFWMLSLLLERPHIFNSYIQLPAFFVCLTLFIHSICTVCFMSIRNCMNMWTFVFSLFFFCCCCCTFSSVLQHNFVSGLCQWTQIIMIIIPFTVFSISVSKRNVIHTMTMYSKDT